MNYKIGIYPFYDIAGNEIIGYYCKKTIRNNKGWKIFVNEKYTYGQFWLTIDVFNIGIDGDDLIILFFTIFPSHIKYPLYLFLLFLFKNSVISN